MKSNQDHRAHRLNLSDIKSIPIRTFWISAIAFFLCFFSWFGIIPLMPDVESELGLTNEQKWNSIILAVSATVIARLLVGKLCDKYGPRLCYTYLLVLGSIPVICTGLVQSPFQFMLCRFFTGFIGASFVITQVHTSLMFAPNIVGTANATSAGWGNLGGGANRLVMPIIATFVVGFGIAETHAWRYCMVIVGLVCLIMGFLYYFLTQDTPEGNFKDLKETGKKIITPKKDEIGIFAVAKDYRVWLLFLVYAACFGIELTVYGTMDEYLQTTFEINRIQAGNMVLAFGLMNIFARTLGGFFGDTFGKMAGLKGRVYFMVLLLIAEGVILSVFSTQSSLVPGLLLLIAFSLSVQMAEGATFSVVPLMNKKAIGSISGIVGAGGNVGALVAAVFLKSQSLETNSSITTLNHSPIASGYFVIGITVVIIGLFALLIRFSESEERSAQAVPEKPDPISI